MDASSAGTDSYDAPDSSGAGSDAPQGESRSASPERANDAERTTVERTTAAPETPATLAHFEPSAAPETPGVRENGKPYVVWSSAPADATTENRED
jgi:hypothetical protein